MSKADKDSLHFSEAKTVSINALLKLWLARKVFRATLLLATLVITIHPLHAQDNSARTGRILDKVVLQLTWFHEFEFAGYYAAQLKGYYLEEGLSVEIRERNPDQLPVDAVLSGEADFGTATSDLILLRMQGKPVIALAVIMQHSPWVLLVRNDSGITVPEDLVGKIVSMDMSYRDAEILSMFKNEGIQIEKINIVAKIPGIDRLNKGEVDARASFINAFDLEQPDHDFRVIRPVNYGIDFYGDTLFTSECMVEERPDQVARFRRACLKGWKYAMEHPEEIAEHILSNYRADLPSEEVSHSLQGLLFEALVMTEELIHPELVEIGHMNPERWQRIADTYAAMGMAEPIDSIDDFLYDPNPKLNYWWLYAGLGLLLGVTFVGTFARIWNKNLHRAVNLRTGELHESYKKHERLVDNLVETFLYRHDVEGDFNYVSSSVTQVLGYTPKEFLDHYSNYLTDHPVNQEAVKHTEQCLSGVQQMPYELEIYHKEGCVRWLEVSEIPVLDRYNKVVAVEGIAHDITERKRAEEKLVLSEAKYSKAFHASPDSITITSVDEGRIVEVNEGFERTFGYSREEVLGKTSLELGLWQKTEDREVLLKALQEEDSVRDLEISIVNKAGDLRDCLLSCEIVDIDEKPFLLSVVRDITDNKLAEAAQRESEERYRTLVENATEAITVLDVDKDRLVDVNSNAEQLFGLDREQLLKCGLVELSPPIQPDGTLSEESAQVHILAALNGELPVFDWVHRNATGQDIQCEVRLVRLPSTTRRLVRGSVTDITERKSMQRRQQLMMAELDHRVKNNITSVLSLVDQTIAKSDSKDDFRDKFSGRLRSLARTHEILAAGKWTVIWLEEAVRLNISPYTAADTSRVIVRGVPVSFPAAAAAPLCMTLHELTTNALKYGALSHRDGTLEVTWSVVNETETILKWIEGGASEPANIKPVGLGMSLIKGFIEFELGGSVNIEPQQDGLICTLVIPAKREKDKTKHVV